MDEHEIYAIKYFAAALIVLSLLEALVYKAFPAVGKYVLWLFYLNVSISALGAAIWHFQAHRAQASCMLSMMVGMAFGMQTGMMIGAVLGATNGFFVGAIAGMLVSTAIGIWGGRASTMGVLQGMMAGVMGGTMGPMITLMMISDHLDLFMPIFLLLNLAITAVGSYMVYKELKPQQAEKKPAGFAIFMALCIIASFVFALIMLYGPKSILVR